VIPTIGSYGIYASQANNTNSGRGRIIGNMVGGDFQTNANAYCLYLTSAKDIDILSNSFHLGSFSGYAAYILGSVPTTDSLRIRGNIFSSANRFGGLGSPLRVVAPAAVKEMSHNVFFGFSPTLIDFGGTLFPNLTAFQATYPNFAGNSYEGFPGFRTDRDLHIICSPYDNLGAPSPLVGNDIDNQLRSNTTPDIGADEFTALAVSIDLGADTSHCGRLTITADTTNFDVFFWDGLPSGPSIVVDSSSQHFVVALDSNNCLASDTILVDILSFPNLVYEGDTVYQCAYDSLDVLNAGSTFLWSTGDTTSAILPNGQGLYTASITNPSGCSATDSVTVLFFAGAVANLGSDSSFCSGGGYLLDAGQGPLGTTYTWNSGANTQVILVSAPGTYAVTVTTLDGCVASDSVFLNVLIPPAVSLGPNRFACDQVLLDAGNQGATFQWSLPGSQTATTQTIVNSNSGLYSVTVTSPNGCSTSDDVQITVSSTPLVNLGPDQLLCNGSSATFNAGNPGFIHQWSSGQSSQSITVTSPGTYLVYVTDPTSQCQGSDTVEVTLSPLSVSLGPDFILCTGSQATLDGGPGAVGYAWNTGSSGQTILVTQAGSYSVTVVDGFGCTASDAIVVSPGIRPSVGFSSPPNVPLLQTANFTDNSAGVNGWLWDFGDGQTSTQQNPVHVYQAMGTFNVCLTATNGDCDSTVCTQITVGPPVEIQDQFLSGHSQLFPNPGNGLYQLKFDLPSVLRLDLCVMDEFGRRVVDWHALQAFDQTESIDIRNQSNGLYYLNLKSEKGHNWMLKLVKQ